jgi:hypothetical protein
MVLGECVASAVRPPCFFSREKFDFFAASQCKKVRYQAASTLTNSFWGTSDLPLSHRHCNPTLHCLNSSLRLSANFAVM